MASDLEKAIEEARENGESVCHVDGDARGALVHPNGDVGNRGAVRVNQEEGECYVDHGSAGSDAYKIAGGDTAEAPQSEAATEVSETHVGVIHPSGESDIVVGETGEIDMSTDFVNCVHNGSLDGFDGPIGYCEFSFLGDDTVYSADAYTPEGANMDVADVPGSTPPPARPIGLGQ